MKGEKGTEKGDYSARNKIPLTTTFQIPTVTMGTESGNQHGGLVDLLLSLAK